MTKIINKLDDRDMTKQYSIERLLKSQKILLDYLEEIIYGFDRNEIIDTINDIKTYNGCMQKKVAYAKKNKSK